MNWYKKAQSKDISLKDIIWAIDNIIIEQDLLTDEDFDIAIQNLGSGQEYVAKAAQTRVVPREKYDRKTFSFPMEKVVLNLFNDGFSTSDIAKKTKLDLNSIGEILSKHIGKTKKQREGYLTKKYKDPIKEVIENFDDRKIPDVYTIAKKLRIDYRLVRKVLNKSKISIRDLVRQRRERLAVVIVAIVDEFEGTGKKVINRNITSEFKKRMGFSIGNTSVNRALARYNRRYSGGRSDPIIQGVKHIFWSQKGVGIDTYLDQYRGADKWIVIDRFIDEFVARYGNNFGYDVTKLKGKEELKKEIRKKMFIDKIRVRDAISKQHEMGMGTTLSDFINPKRHKEIIEYIGKGYSPEQISKATRIKEKAIRDFADLYNIKHFERGTDKSHPANFLTDRE